jgi:hypothetical protein
MSIYHDAIVVVFGVLFVVGCAVVADGVIVVVSVVALVGYDFVYTCIYF